MTDSKHPVVSLTWAEGRYFDRWMLVHFISGVAGGFSNIYFGLSLVQLYGLALGLMLLWEVGELAQAVHESLTNRVLDIVVGLAGVQVAVWITPRLPEGSGLAAFLVTLGVGLVGMAFGVRAYYRRTR